MADTLVIVESPAKAKTIGKFLGSKYKVIASQGHIRDLPKSQLGVDVENGFEPKYITLHGRSTILNDIKKAAKESKKIYLATDPDREGEAISWHLAELLKIDPLGKCRIEFHEITSAAVKSAIKNVRSVNMDLVDAQQARRVLDRLVGYKISPILWTKVRKGLSAGRVQSVATRIICDREQEINDFISEEYWIITATFDNQKKFSARFFSLDGEQKKIVSKEEADYILSEAKSGVFTVSDIKFTEKKKHPAPPFTTSSLQQEASRKLNFTTKKTMSLAQMLYEGIELGNKGPVGLISYIRTDSVRVAEEAQKAALNTIETLYGKEYVPSTPNIYKGRKDAQDAHEAIRPTDMGNTPKSIQQYLTNEQFKLYKLIYDRFIASQMADARFNAETVSLSNGRLQFHASGMATLFDGYTIVYTEGKDDADEEQGILPSMKVGDTFTATSIVPEQKFTQPPSRYTEATLVKTLEEKGIGRPSTYAPTISTIVERGYVAREKKSLIPTELGFVVTNLVKENFANIADVSFTAGMEDELDKIEEGAANWRDVVSGFYIPFEEDVKKAGASIEKVKIEDPVSDTPCDKCGAMMVIKNGKFGKFLACPNFPTCRNTKTIIEKINVTCPDCGKELIKKRSKNGRTFYGCEGYPECQYVSWDRPVDKKCPKCGKLLVIKSGTHGTYLACPDRINCKYVFRQDKSESADIKE